MDTPWAHTWDAAWAARVDEREAELGRRICGAKTLVGNPWRRRAAGTQRTPNVCPMCAHRGRLNS